MNDRCKKIIEILSNSSEPVTASALAKQLSVSRQIIVGDVAILRASGSNIIATAKGYLFSNDVSTGFPFVGTIACCHSQELLRDELYTIVDFGATVIDVSVEHSIYGELTGKLDLSSRYDVDQFIDKVTNDTNSAPISSLTNGVHLHHLGCRDEDSFIRIRTKLEEQGIAMH